MNNFTAYNARATSRERSVNGKKGKAASPWSKGPMSCTKRAKEIRAKLPALGLSNRFGD
jgi:hypothetical protein